MRTRQYIFLINLALHAESQMLFYNVHAQEVLVSKTAGRPRLQSSLGLLALRLRNEIFFSDIRLMLRRKRKKLALRFFFFLLLECGTS